MQTTLTSRESGTVAMHSEETSSLQLFTAGARAINCALGENCSAKMGWNMTCGRHRCHETIVTQDMKAMVPWNKTSAAEETMHFQPKNWQTTT